MSDMINILLVEDNAEKRGEFNYHIQLHPHLNLCGETGSQTEALRLLQIGKTDVVILDLELEEGNGIQFAEEMRKLPINQPFVVVTTNNSSESILQYMRSELKVDFIFQKTNLSYTAEQVLDIIEKVYKYHRYENPKRADERKILRDRIYRELKDMGFSSRFSGTDYLVDVFMFLANHPDDSLHVSKIIYPFIARKYCTDPANVERAIRTSIERVWNKSNLITLSKHYPYDVENKNGRPSNSEFIANMRLKFFGK